jgi:hypothetical protein
LSDEDRAAASMFYVGYEASRLRSKNLNVGAISNIQAEALQYCNAYPNRPAYLAFARAYLRANR